MFIDRWQQKQNSWLARSKAFFAIERAFWKWRPQSDFSHVLLLPASRINDALAETREESEESFTRLHCDERDRVWVRKSNLIFSFVLHRQHVRAWKYRTGFALPLGVACETRISYLSVCLVVPILPRVSTLDSSLEGERWWHQEGCQSGRGRGGGTKTKTQRTGGMRNGSCG